MGIRSRLLPRRLSAPARVFLVLLLAGAAAGILQQLLSRHDGAQTGADSRKRLLQVCLPMPAS